MCAGDFLEIYTENGELFFIITERIKADEGVGVFDGVVTCFFLDTARNVVHYIEQIYKLLKPNGVWINLGW